MTGWDSPGFGGDPFPMDSGREEMIELVGPHLRVSGRIALGRFSRLTDLVNHNRGYVRLHGATLLRRNGEPTSLVVAELMVNQDEITFIGQAGGALADDLEDRDPADDVRMGDSRGPAKARRRFVVFTPGHAIAGSINVHEEMTLATFVDASEPRFVPMTSVTARSLADRRVFSHFAFLLVNRTQMTAVAEADPGAEVGDVAPETPEGGG